MCILCVIQKWSRKVATMLPWLVIPLIGLWLLSQFLPPAFRFEITSPRLACVMVLLITLFWYEILMPQLSLWRVRRSARLRERKRNEEIEMQKLRKTATRRCRNCLTPYRDQNPSGGKFMCSYCGHISKRPVLDLSVPPGLSHLSKTGFLKDFVAKGRKLLNGKNWSDSNWICGQDWLENGGNWVNGSLSGKSSSLKKNRGSYCNFSVEHSFSEKPFSFIFVSIFKNIAAIFYGIIWLCGRLFRLNFTQHNTSSDSDIHGLAKKGENGINLNESKSEKARRKAEEKRQARLEREQLEEEERKQREEVARLVEERRKLRDVKSVTEKAHQRKSSPHDKTEKREAERKRQERKKEKDRGSSKSNSDVDELEKRASKESEKTKKGETDRRDHQSSKFVASNNYNKGSVGSRYLDRMRGNFFPSSRTFTSGGFFGKGTNVNSSNTREHKSSTFLDNVQITVTKRDFVKPERTHVKSNTYTEDQNHNRQAVFESQPNPAPKRSWQQLFTRSSSSSSSSSSSLSSSSTSSTTTTTNTAAAASSTTTSVISRPNGKPQTEVESSLPFSYQVKSEGFDTPVSFGLPYPLPSFPYTNSTTTTITPSFEESDSFEDPCYVPDPTSLIGPVSESLNDFQLDLGFVPDVGFEVNRQSPIESPMSRLRVSEEMKANSFMFPSTQQSNYEKKSLPVEDLRTEKGWQMWNSSPFCQDTLGLVGRPPNWYNPELNGLKNEDPWALRSSYGSIPNNNHHLPVNLNEGITQSEAVYRNPDGVTPNHQFPIARGGVWAKKENGDPGIGTSSAMIGPVGGLYSTSDVQSLWSYE